MLANRMLGHGPDETAEIPAQEGTRLGGVPIQHDADELA